MPSAREKPTVNLGDMDRRLAAAMQEARVTFTPVFIGLVIVIVLMILVTLGAMIWICLADWGELTKADKALIGRALVARFIQIAFGMILGASCVMLGVIVAWLGITAAFTIKGTAEKGGARAGIDLGSVSPGVLLILGGIILIGCSLFRDIGYTERFDPEGGRAPTPTSDGGPDETPQPKEPPG